MPPKTASKIPPIAVGTIPTPLPQLYILRAIFSISLFLRQGLNYVALDGLKLDIKARLVSSSEILPVLAIQVL